MRCIYYEKLIFTFKGDHNNINYIRENAHKVGSILFKTNFIITQLAMFDLLLRFNASCVIMIFFQII